MFENNLVPSFRWSWQTARGGAGPSVHGIIDGLDGDNHLDAVPGLDLPRGVWLRAPSDLGLPEAGVVGPDEGLGHPGVLRVTPLVAVDVVSGRHHEGLSVVVPHDDGSYPPNLETSALRSTGLGPQQPESLYQGLLPPLVRLLQGPVHHPLDDDGPAGRLPLRGGVSSLGSDVHCGHRWSAGLLLGLLWATGGAVAAPLAAWAAAVWGCPLLERRPATLTTGAWQPLPSPMVMAPSG